jgi:hypothetical protein
MTRAHNSGSDGYHELTLEEYRALFDREARRRFGLSGSEFIARYDAGEIDVDDPRIHSDAIALEMMLPIVRETLAHS